MPKHIPIMKVIHKPMIKSLIRVKPNSIISLSSVFIIPSRIKFSISFIYLHLKLTHLFYTFRDIVLISPQWTSCICFRNSHFFCQTCYTLFYFYRYALFLHFMYLFIFLIISHFYPVFTAMSKIDHIIVKTDTLKKLRVLTLLPQLLLSCLFSIHHNFYTKHIFIVTEL